MRATFGAQIQVREFFSSCNLDSLLSDIEAVAAKTYHRGLGVGFVDKNETRQIMKLACQRGWLRAYVLYIDGRPCAFWNGFLYRRVFFTGTTGYDPDYGQFRPGSFLLQHMLESLCREGAADEVDFGFGDAQYKRDWCDRHSQQVSLLLFAPTFKGVCLNLLRSPLMAISNAARALSGRSRAVQVLKRTWRRSLRVDRDPPTSGVRSTARGVLR